MLKVVDVNEDKGGREIKMEWEVICLKKSDHQLSLTLTLFSFKISLILAGVSSLIKTKV